MGDILIFFSGVCINRLQMCTAGVTLKDDKQVIQISMSNGMVFEESFNTPEECETRMREITGESQ